MLELNVINIWAAPAVGKSTTAAGLFNLMKQMPGVRVELVTEFAKDLTYGKDYGSLENQLYILAEQDRRIRRLEGQVDFAIVDSPLPLGLAYMTKEYEDWLPDAVLGAYERYMNFDFLLVRKKPFQAYGRNQTEHEALALDVNIREIFRHATGWNGENADYDNEAYVVAGDEFAPFQIAQHLPLPNMEKLLAA